MKVSNIFTDTTRELRYGTRRIIHQGGQNSGKTVNVLGSLATVAAEDGPGVTTVTSMSFPHLSAGALRDFEMYVYPTFKDEIVNYNKTNHIFTFASGHQIEFRVFESEMAARGPKRKRLFVNEVNKMDKMTFFQLDSRSDQSIVDYNPSIRFFVHDELIGYPENKLFISNHWNNPFLSASKHREIESIATFARDKFGNVIFNDKGEPVVTRGDFELWKVYARGITGNVVGIIFPNWIMVDESELPSDTDWFFGIDFGYTNDPTAIMKMCKVGNKLFVKELSYETGLPPIQIKNILLANGYKSHQPLYCEHDRDMIRALRNLGLAAFPALKGQGSVNAGIELLKTFDVCYTSNSRNLHSERGKYIWITDKETGKLTNIPVDNNNHCFDAIRYGAYTKYIKQT